MATKIRYRNDGSRYYYDDSWDYYIVEKPDGSEQRFKGRPPEEFIYDGLQPPSVPPPPYIPPRPAPDYERAPYPQDRRNRYSGDWGGPAGNPGTPLINDPSLLGFNFPLLPLLIADAMASEEET